MNRHFPTTYDIINDTDEHFPDDENKPWYGIILHTETVIAEITLAGGPKITDQPTINLLVKDVPVGTPFLMQIKQIKLSTPACKMINQN